MEELERQGHQTDNIHHNSKIASNIARRELKILKIYQEWAESVWWKLCKNYLKPNMFYSHEWIQNLIGWEEDLDINKSKFELRKISSQESLTPIDEWQTVKRSQKYCSPVTQHHSRGNGKFTILNSFSLYNRRVSNNRFFDGGRQWSQIFA